MNAFPGVATFESAAVIGIEALGRFGLSGLVISATGLGHIVLRWAYELRCAMARGLIVLFVAVAVKPIAEPHNPTSRKLNEIKRIFVVVTTKATRCSGRHFPDVRRL
jgi:hypothetical protein